MATLVYKYAYWMMSQEKLTQTKKVRSKIVKLKQDTGKPDFGRS